MGVINWLIFWIIPVVNHIYLVGKNKPAIKILNWFFSIFYMMYLYPIFNGFVGQKLVVQPAYIISMYCFIIAMKDTFMDPIHKKKEILKSKALFSKGCLYVDDSYYCFWYNNWWTYRILCCSGYRYLDAG
jgi:hypothetical protein